MEWSKKVFLALLEKDPNFNTKIELYGFQDYSVLQNPTATTTQKQTQPTTMSLPQSTYTNIMDDPNVDEVKYLELLLEELTKPNEEEKPTQQQLWQKYVSTSFIASRWNTIR